MPSRNSPDRRREKISDNVAAETNTITNLASKVDDGVAQLKALVAQLRASSVGANLDPVAMEQLALQVSAQADQIAQDNAEIQEGGFTVAGYV